MKIISIGSDRKLFEPGSRVAQRIIEYAKEVEEMHIIVFSLSSLGFSSRQLSQNVWVYPTSSINRLWYISDALKMGREVIKGRPLLRGNALITTQDPFESGVVGVLLKRIFTLPLQVQLHTDIGSTYFNRGMNKIRRFVARFVFKHADTVRVVSTLISEYVMKEFSIPLSRMSVLPVFLDKNEIVSAPEVPNLHAAFPQFKDIILMVGRLEEEKNYPFALTIFSNIVKTHPSTGLIIVGEGKEKKKLEHLVQELHIERNVVFEDRAQALIPFYKTADIFLHTSVFEGYGLVFAEAALAGCPIVSSTVGIARDFQNGEEALLCPVEDGECFLHSLDELLKEKEKRIALSRAARQAIEKNVLSKEEFLARLRSQWEQTLNAS